VSYEDLGCRQLFLIFAVSGHEVLLIRQLPLNRTQLSQGVAGFSFPYGYVEFGSIGAFPGGGYPVSGSFSFPLVLAPSSGKPTGKVPQLPILFLQPDQLGRADGVLFLGEASVCFGVPVSSAPLSASLASLGTVFLPSGCSRRQARRAHRAGAIRFYVHIRYWW